MAETCIVASLATPLSSEERELHPLRRYCEWLEVRADILGDLGTARLRDVFPGKLLYSLPSIDAGGCFAGSDSDRRSRLCGAARRYDLVTLEERDFHPDVLSRIAPEQRVISWSGDPPSATDLTKYFERLSAVPAMLYKLEIRNGRASDGVALMSFLKTLKRADVVAFLAGETGFWTRLVASHLGAPVIFASVEPAWTAGGAPSVEQLVADYGLPGKTEFADIFGIVGYPVSHSLSPRIHNAAYSALGHRGLFVAFQEESFSDFWDALIGSDQLDSLGCSIKGLTVASPHKEVALTHASTASPMSKRVGASNVFVRNGEGWRAETTDPEGLVFAREKFGLSVRGRAAAVVGCGGAGRAMAVALEQAGASVTLVNRGTTRGHMASEMLGLPCVPLSSFNPSGFSIVVNATPVGRNDGRIPFDIGALGRDAAVIDLVYGREPTPLVSRARKAGLMVVDGSDVLEAQVLRQFHMMTGKRMPVQLLREQLGRRREPASPASRRRNVMDSFKYVKAEDSLDQSAIKPPATELDFSSLVGEWVNTNPVSEGVARVVLTLNGHRLLVRMLGGTGSPEDDWGTVEADSVFASGIASRQASAFSAKYRFDSKEAHLLTNLSLGLLIVAICKTARDAGRPVSFSREFYRRVAAA